MSTDQAFIVFLWGLISIVGGCLYIIFKWDDNNPNFIDKKMIVNYITAFMIFSSMMSFISGVWESGKMKEKGYTGCVHSTVMSYVVVGRYVGCELTRTRFLNEAEKTPQSVELSTIKQQ